MKSWLTMLVAFVLSGALTAAVQQPVVSVDKLADSVYLFTYDAHRSMFIVSPDGVLVTDPQSPEAAKRYLQEIRKITSSPIRYLVYSHYHDDHASGGAELGTVPVVIAHANVRTHLPQAGRAIVPPTVTFADTASVFLGELEVRLISPGFSETDSNIVMFVPARRLAFVVDSIVVRGLPWRDMASGNPAQWIAAIRQMLTIDFDVLAPGHGPVGAKADAQAFLDYMVALKDAVETRMKQGQSLEQIQSSLELPQYAGWERYQEHFKLNIAGVYREASKR